MIYIYIEIKLSILVNLFDGAMFITMDKWSTWMKSNETIGMSMYIRSYDYTDGNNLTFIILNYVYILIMILMIILYNIIRIYIYLFIIIYYFISKIYCILYYFSLQFIGVIII